MKIAIIGTGSVGTVLGKGWAKHGHTIIFGTRQPDNETVQTLVANIGPQAKVKPIADVTAEADIIVLAVPWHSVQETIATLGDVTGKLLIDCTNPILPGFQLAVGTTTSGAEQVATWAVGATIAKAFNTTGAENMADPIYGDEPTAMFICGDEEEAKDIVSQLATALGFAVVDVGPLETARLIEPLALLWIRLAVVQGLGRNMAFKIVQR